MRHVLGTLSPTMQQRTHKESTSRQFFLSNHCEMVETRCINRDHCKLDTIVPEVCRDYMNKTLKLPARTSYKSSFNFLTDGSFGVDDDEGAIRAHHELKQ